MLDELLGNTLNVMRRGDGEIRTLVTPIFQNNNLYSLRFFLFFTLEYFTKKFNTLYSFTIIVKVFDTSH